MAKRTRREGKGEKAEVVQFDCGGSGRGGWFWLEPKVIDTGCSGTLRDASEQLQVRLTWDDLTRLFWELQKLYELHKEGTFITEDLPARPFLRLAQDMWQVPIVAQVYDLKPIRGRERHVGLPALVLLHGSFESLDSLRGALFTACYDCC